MNEPIKLSILGYEYIPESKTYFINGMYKDSWELLLPDLINLKTIYETDDEKMPFWVKGLTTFGHMLNSYQAQNREFRRKLKRDSKKAVKRLLKKSENNRFQNTTTDKLVDNLRYILSRRFNLASSNNAPIGFYDSLYLALLDRGNLMEYSSLNLNNTYFPVSKYINMYTKKQVMYVLDTLIDDNGESIPKGIISIRDCMIDDGTSQKYSVHDLIGDDGIKALLNEVIPFNILVADKVVCINEMKNFNGKSNPWEGPHYLFQYLNTYNGYDCDVLFRVLEVEEKKIKTDDGKDIVVITNDGLQSLRNHFGTTLFDGCPELVPALAIVHRAYANVIHNFDIGVDISEDDQTEQTKTFIKLYESMGRLSNRDAMDSMYKEYFDRNDDYSGKELEDVKVLKAINRHIKNESLKDIETKFINLSKAIAVIRADENHSRYQEALKINNSFIKKIIQKDSIRLLVSASLAILDTKFGVEEGSEQNVKNLLSIFSEKVCGDEVFTVDINGKGNPIDYEIKDIDFLDTVQSSSSDFGGKGTFIYKRFIEAFREVHEEIGLDDGKNPELTKKELKFLEAATDDKDCYWYESDTKGRVGERGMRDRKKLPLTSIEHGKDPLNNWEKVYFEDTSINSGKGRAVSKPILKGDGYKAHRRLQDELLKNGSINKKQHGKATLNLDMVIEHWDDLVKNGEIVIEEMETV